MELPADVLAWRARGAFHVLAGREVSVLDATEPALDATHEGSPLAERSG